MAQVAGARESGGKGRAQVAIEYMTVVALLLGAVAIVFSYSIIMYQQGMASAKANSAVSALGNAAEQAGALGEGTTLFVVVEFPADVHSGSVSEHMIMVKLGAIGGTGDVYETTKAKLRVVAEGDLPTGIGFHEFRVEVIAGEVVFTEV